MITRKYFYEKLLFGYNRQNLKKRPGNNIALLCAHFTSGFESNNANLSMRIITRARSKIKRSKREKAFFVWIFGRSRAENFVPAMG